MALIRASLLPAVLLGAIASLLAQAPEWPQVRTVRLVGGLDMPTDIQSARDGSGRLFIVEQRGQIRIWKNGQLLPVPFLDLRSRVTCCGETGLLGLAFPPNFAAKRYFYVNYTTGGAPPNLRTVIARFPVTSNPDVADPDSEQVILTFPQPFTNHNGGQLAFSPKDGYLYIGAGDGGSGGDPQNNAQNPGALLGKMLRIDVESGASPYAVPPSNPFVAASGYRPEIWALGLRNPWRYAFDRVTSDLFIADVGQNRIEEIDFQPAASRGGENYGWNLMEGSQCFGAGCSSSGLVLPVAEYGRDLGCSVTGGYIYRGVQPDLRGIYFYSDYCSGRIWGLRSDGAAWQTRVLLETGFSVSTFGEDQAGEIYFARYGAGNGEIYRLTGVRPLVANDATVNAASFSPGIVPGSLATVFGVRITSATGIIGASALPLPTELNGTAVLVNGLRAPIHTVANVNGQEQINFQAPWQTAAGKASIAVLNGNETSNPVEVDVLPAQPGVFALAGGAGAILHASFELVSATSPAAKDEVVLVFATGLGQVINPPGNGEAASRSSLSTTVAVPRVTIGARNAEVLYSGLAPGLVGVYQINVRVPRDAPIGDAELMVTMAGQASRAVKIALR